MHVITFTHFLRNMARTIDDISDTFAGRCLPYEYSVVVDIHAKLLVLSYKNKLFARVTNSAQIVPVCRTMYVYAYFLC